MVRKSQKIRQSTHFDSLIMIPSKVSTFHEPFLEEIFGIPNPKWKSPEQVTTSGDIGHQVSQGHPFLGRNCQKCIVYPTRLAMRIGVFVAAKRSLARAAQITEESPRRQDPR